MKSNSLICTLICCIVGLIINFPESSARSIKVNHSTVQHWNGKKAIVLGDSISDKNHIGTTKCWWEFLEEDLNMNVISYAINGNESDGVLNQAMCVLEEQKKNFDLMLIFIGTNDFNNNLPLGEWFSEERLPVNRNGRIVNCLHRTPTIDNRTFRGRLNALATFLKHNFPDKQIVFLTPIHRAFAQFGPKNIQPDELWANEVDLYLEDYVAAIKELGNIWSFPVIDLYEECGLYPIENSFTTYFHNTDNDRLHPNIKGHKRMAATISINLSNIPCY